MSELGHMLHVEHPSAESIADELIAARKPRKYAGVARAARTGKRYRHHEHVMVCGVKMRLLSAAELAQFRAHVDGCLSGSSQPIRLEVAQ